MSSFVAKNNNTRREQQLRVIHLRRILEEIKDIQKQYQQSIKDNLKNRKKQKKSKH